MRERGIDAAAVLRQPSMGITAAGSKGGASGGGKASLTHPELIDWGLCGEMGAIEAAQNLLVSFAEKAVDDGKLDTILVPRVSEVPSRSLRQIAVDRGKGDVAERVVLTPTCELMQIVVLSRSMDEISERVAKMVAGTKDGKAVTFGEFVDLWRITGILGDAVKPAKTETVNGSPVYVHGGPFANVSIGIPTLVSVEMACALHDVVIVEAGYGTDAGAQKWLDIACREYDAQWPSAAIVVTRASTWRDDPDLAWRYPFHVQRLEGLDIPTFPLINLWDGEDDQIPALKDTAKELEFRDPIIGNLYRDGGDALAPAARCVRRCRDERFYAGRTAQPQGHGSGGERALGRRACVWRSGRPCDSEGRFRRVVAGRRGSVRQRGHRFRLACSGRGEVSGHHDRQRLRSGSRAHRHAEEGRSAFRRGPGAREPHHVADHPDAEDRLIFLRLRRVAVRPVPSRALANR